MSLSSPLKALEQALPRQELIGTQIGDLIVKVAHEYGLPPTATVTLTDMCIQLIEFGRVTNSLDVHQLKINEVMMSRLKVVVLACGSENNDINRIQEGRIPHQLLQRQSPEEQQLLRDQYADVTELQKNMRKQGVDELTIAQAVISYSGQEGLNKVAENTHRLYSPWLCRLLAELGAQVKGLDIVPPGPYAEKWSYQKCDLTQQGSVSQIVPPQSADMVVCRDFVLSPANAIAMSLLQKEDPKKYGQIILSVIQEIKSVLRQGGNCLFNRTHLKKDQDRLRYIEVSPYATDEKDVRPFLEYA